MKGSSGEDVGAGPGSDVGQSELIRPPASKPPPREKSEITETSKASGHQVDSQCGWRANQETTGAEGTL